MLGTFVTYTDSSGRNKVALVVGTSENIAVGSALDLPGGVVIVTVFSPSGSHYTRTVMLDPETGTYKRYVVSVTMEIADEPESVPASEDGAGKSEPGKSEGQLPL